MMGQGVIRIRVSAALAEAFQRELEKSGYGPRQKGRWVGEALVQLKKKDPQLERVGLGDENDVPRKKMLGISLVATYSQVLKEMVMHCRKQAPLIEGVQALVIRSAIRDRVRSSSKTSSSSSKASSSKTS